MAARINPAALFALIICVILTLLFTVLVIVRTSAINRQLEGDPEKPGFKKISQLQGELKAARDELQASLDALHLKQGDMYRAELQTHEHRLAYNDQGLIASVATPAETKAVLKGVPGQPEVTLKSSRLKVAQEQIAEITKRLESQRAEYESADRQSFPPLTDAIQKRLDETKAVLQKIADNDANFKADMQRLQDQKDKLEKELAKIEKDRRTDSSQRQTKIVQLEDRIRELLERELRFLAELEPVGSVLRTNDTEHQFIINLGSGDRVQPGLLFEVFQYDKGRYVEKGMAEVIEVEPTISTCRLITVIDQKRNPVSRGDYIGNPCFNPHRPKVFVVAGEFKRYNKTDIEMFIRRTGGIVRDKLSPGVDFFIAGDRSEKEQANAREYQILAMTEDQVLKYVGKTFSTTK